jgi:secreted trypsin-like serine protease
MPMLWTAVLAAGCARTPRTTACFDSTDGRAGISDGAPDDGPAYGATGAFVIRPFGRVVLICTGTMVALRAVLTAAHCVTGHSPYRLEFTLDRDALGAPQAAIAPVRRVFLNPQYDLRASGSLHDIALVELDAPLGRSHCERWLSPAEAPRMLGPGAAVELVGYSGRVADGVPFGSKAATRATIASLGTDEMTVGGPGEPQGCVGDSGGPAFARDATGARRLVAVTSRSANDATECTDGSIHTRVDAYAAWLATTLATIEAK